MHCGFITDIKPTEKKHDREFINIIKYLSVAIHTLLFSTHPNTHVPSLLIILTLSLKGQTTHFQY